MGINLEEDFVVFENDKVVVFSTEGEMLYYLKNKYKKEYEEKRKERSDEHTD